MFLTNVWVLSKALEFVTNNKGRPQLVYRNFLYNLDNGVPGGRQSWVCRDYRRLFCRARVITRGHHVDVRGTPHNHNSHAHIIYMKRLESCVAPSFV
ncbi:hypothetical protein PR048_032476 [Dryococelus australis]|uniref:FLYWCH-type domain-containing protein n=1 Tax=Dryococelus australis TaxID=614101 RepID=A0ABQ9G2A7_9NEOP|nr:hypothetical protein PR048_032476 [Dryococelus australis]